MVIAEQQSDAPPLSDESLARVDKLLEVLDADIEHIELSLQWLDDLRCLVVKRDESAMSILLERIRTHSLEYEQIEKQRKVLCIAVAEGIGLDPAGITLSKIEERLSGSRKTAAGEKKARLRTLAEHLRSRYQSTATLLADCARFNGMLLNGILGSSKSNVVTYRPNGSVGRSGRGALMDIRF